MAVSITDNFHTSLCESFYNNVVTGRDNLYYFIGATVPWNTTDLPPEYTGTVDEEMSIRKNLVSLKKVQPSDISFGVRRVNWIPGVIYDEYDSNIPMRGKDFYVITNEFSVYKCISNNNGVPSTQRPTGFSINPVRYSDGYWWKFMYQVPFSSRNKYILDTHIPVSRALTDQFYSNGSIESITIINGGSGYNSENKVTINVTGTGTGAILIPVVSSTGKIVSVFIKNPGSGYTTAPTLEVESISTGSGCVLTAEVTGGMISRIIIQSQGSEYPPDANVTISIQGDGTGAKVIPLVDEGIIVDVIIEEQGTGYTFANIEVISSVDPGTQEPFGTGAKLVSNLSLGDLTSIQSIIEQTAIEGAIYSIKLLSGGTNYTASTTVRIEGDGQGATAVPIIQNGAIVGVEMTNVGFGYHNVKVSFISSTGSGASARAIVTPLGGHGRNAVKELLADCVIVSTTINNEPVQGVFIENDYRQYGLISNPLFFDSQAKYSRQLGASVFKLEVSNTTGITQDDEIILSDAKRYNVVFVEDNFLLVNGEDNAIPLIGEIGRKEGSVFSFTVSDVTLPDVNKYSGIIYYVNNQMGIDYSDNQLLTIRTVINL